MCAGEEVMTTGSVSPRLKAHCPGGFFFLAAVLFFLAGPATGRADDWTLTGSMSAARAGHTTSLLPNGKVLVTGGITDSNHATNTCEIYDPTSRTWSPTGSMSTARVSHTATLLPNGKVLVAGGQDTSGTFLTTCELYDPTTGTWSGTGGMSLGRSVQSAVLLDNGQVLVVGGVCLGGTDYIFTDTCELYDPAAGTWSGTGRMSSVRGLATAVLLQNGKALIAGGARDFVSAASDTVEIYDNGSWTVVGHMSAARAAPTATLLSSGKVLIAGGYDSIDGVAQNTATASCDLYDPTVGTAGSLSATGAMGTARGDHTATLLSDGTVLAAGGTDDETPVASTYASAERYDPGKGTWSAVGSLHEARNAHDAILLPDRMVLVVGGAGTTGNLLSSAEIYGGVPAVAPVAPALSLLLQN